MSTHSNALSAIANLKLEVTSRRLDELRPHPRNPRTHPARQIKKLADNIKLWGFLVPVVVDGTGQILAGHASVLAARRLGMVEVPSICVDHLDEAQAQAFLIADNRLNELSTWDDQTLAELLLHLSLQNADFSLDLTGFDMGASGALARRPRRARPMPCRKSCPGRRLPSPVTSGCSAGTGCSAAARSKRTATRP